MSAGARVRPYRRLALLPIMTELAYRFEALVYGLMIVTQVFLFYLLWSALYRPGQVSAGMTFRQAVTYSTLAAVVSGRRGGWGGAFVTRIRDGSIAYLFLRPVTPLGHFWAEQAGTVAYRLAWFGAAALIAVALGLVVAPATIGVFAITVVSLLVAEGIFSFMELFIQLAAFWTIEIDGLRGLYFFSIQLLSGALVPLWFFPSWTRNVLLSLPFASAASTPISLWVGRITPARALGAIALQLAWFVALGVAAKYLWRRVERRVVVQGG